MKKIFFTALILIAFISCKNESKTDQTKETISSNTEERTEKQSDGLTLLKGEFVYFDGAAVLQTSNEIYGVLVTDKMLELNEMAKKFKKEPTDMVLVEIRGKITSQKDEKILWENKVEVIGILNVKQPRQEENNIVKLGQ